MSQCENIQPLKWPVDWANLTTRQRLLLDAPFIGVLDRAFKGIVVQIQQRPQECPEYWSQFSKREKAVEDAISRIAMEEIGWPNSHFIPDDPFEIIMWDGGDDLATAAALGRLEKELGLKRKSDSEWQNLASHTYGYVVQRLAEEVAITVKN
jgi:hypothetical protein